MAKSLVEGLVDKRHVALGACGGDPGIGPNALAMAIRVIPVVLEELEMEAMGLEAPPRREIDEDISGNREMQRNATRASINSRAMASWALRWRDVTSYLRI